MTAAQSIKVSLFRRSGEAVWRMQYRDQSTGNKVRRSCGTSKRREAERMAAKWEQELRAGVDHNAGKIDWDIFREKYQFEAASSLAEKTQQKIESVLNVYERMMKPRKLGDIDERAISRYQQLLRENGRAEDTIAGHLDHLKAMLSWAVQMKYLQAMPAVRKPQRAKSRKNGRDKAQPMKGRPLTGEEMDRLLDAVPGVLRSRWVCKKLDFEAAVASWRFYLQGLWTSGLRLGESLELHWTDRAKLCINDIDAAAPTMAIPSELEKGNTDREAPLAPEFVQLLRTVQERDGFVFAPMPLRPSVDRLSAQQVTRMVGRFGEAAGIVVNEKTRKTASAHDLRRSFGDRWAQRVMPAILKELMRHESISTTMRYYVGRQAVTTAELLWGAVGAETGAAKSGFSRDAADANAPVRPVGAVLGASLTEAPARSSQKPAKHGEK